MEELLGKCGLNLKENRQKKKKLPLKGENFLLDFVVSNRLGKMTDEVKFLIFIFI